MTRNTYIQICAFLIVVTLSLSGLSVADGGGAAPTIQQQDRTMSINGVAVDGDDNVIVTGEVYDSAAEKWIIRTEKYDGSDGHLIWRRECKEYSQNIGKDVAVDASGNVIVAGATGKAGTQTLPQMDYFLIKYSDDGKQVLWKHQYDYGLSDVPWRVTVDEQTGNIFVTGVTIKLVGGNAATTDFWTIKCSGGNGKKMNQHILNVKDNDDDNADMGTGVALTGGGEVVVTGSTGFDGPNYDAYCTQRYDTNLQPLGDPFFYHGKNTNESASGLAVDSNDNIFVTGHSSGRPGQDFLTVKYDKNGEQQKKDLRNVGDGKNSALDIAVDHADNVIITGSTVSGSKHFCTIKYDNSLNKKWIEQESFVGEAKAVTVDSQNNVIVAGYNANQENQYYTIKYDPNGNILWEGGGGAGPAEPPTASFNAPGNAYVGQPVQFTDTSSGDVDTRSWDLDGDGTTDADGKSPTHTYASPGTYTVTLTVSGDAGEDTATRQITVSNAPPIPSFSYTPLAPTVGTAVSLDASDSYDPYQGSIASYTWDFGDGETGSGETTSHSYTENGTYQITLTVTDAGGKSASTSKKVTVNTAGSKGPTAMFTYDPAHPDIGEDITFDASASTDDGTIILYRWDWNSDGTYEEDLAAPTATHSWSEDGTYSVTLQVEDNNGTTATYTASVTVGGGEPTLLLSAPSSIELSNGRATAIVTVNCLNRTVDNVHIEVASGEANVSVYPEQAPMQAGTRQNFSLELELPDSQSSGTVSIRAVGDDGVQSELVDISLEEGSAETPGFAALLAIAAIFIVLLAMRRFK